MGVCLKKVVCGTISFSNEPLLHRVSIQKGLLGFPQIPSDWGKWKAQELKKIIPGHQADFILILLKSTQYQRWISHIYTLPWLRLKTVGSHSGKHNN